MSGLRSATAGLALSFLPACAVGPDYVRPEPALPSAWQELPDGVATGPAEVSRWWKAFADPVLDRLVDRAVAGNRDLRQA
ncbi:MAG: efflux transporter outer membrane subunit, partial [Candidatus Binatia bacterium]